MSTVATWPDLLRQLEAEGFSEGPNTEDVLALLDEDEPMGQPWYIRVLVTASAWFAAVLIMVFGVQLFNSSEGAIGVGTVFLVGALAIRWRTKGFFLHQLAFAFSLAGQLAIVGGVMGVTREPAWAWATAIALEMVLIFLYPDVLHRFLSTLFLGLSVAGLLVALEWRDGIHVLVLALTVGSVGWWSREAQVRCQPWGSRYAVVGYGFVTALLGILMLSIVPELMEIQHWWASTFVLTAGMAWLIYEILHGEGRVIGKEGAGWLALFVVIGLLTYAAPGIMASLLVLLLGFSRGNRLLMGLALLFLGIYLIFFYYHLEMLLLVKSLMLMGTGALFLVLRTAYLQWGKEG